MGVSGGPGASRTPAEAQRVRASTGRGMRGGLTFPSEILYFQDQAVESEGVECLMALFRRLIHWLLEVPTDKRWTRWHQFHLARHLHEDPDDDSTYW